MSDGREFKGPCNHTWRYVFNQFAMCTIKGCSGNPRCPKCGTAQVEPFVCEGVPPGTWHCIPNGHCWHPGV